ncbi:phosphonate ABC transporter ATP-binding protein [methane-oxidizing endosymbiont of Gigantopelta aegis]|uniref:phosphonate ABC transporter ATP-binding protein n=1 Tax=methane-oxidizing endosymbiont of Gigantopelta aegis TaxID=2794938 RepID=UPI0018DD94FF|nr:ATP-binding cassette domain-containing protein [methane-oxidizing endosymbiont of Gigantopelta aegis]
MKIDNGEFVSIIGPSGAGKSTFLRALIGLVESDTKDIVITGENQNQIWKRKGKTNLSMIFQDSNLILTFSVYYNVLLGRLGYLKGWKKIFFRFSDEDKKIALKSLEQVGLEEYTFKSTINLSGGQKQRVAIAKALAQEANIILADEPISSLDPEKERVLNLLIEINKMNNTTVLINLHQLDLAKKYSNRIIGLREGKVVFNGSPLDFNDRDYKYLYGLTYDK